MGAFRRDHIHQRMAIFRFQDFQRIDKAFIMFVSEWLPPNDLVFGSNNDFLGILVCIPTKCDLVSAQVRKLFWRPQDAGLPFFYEIGSSREITAIIWSQHLRMIGKFIPFVYPSDAACRDALPFGSGYKPLLKSPPHSLRPTTCAG